MALNHGINTTKSDTNFQSVVTAQTGIPFYVGCWPCHKGAGYTGKPQLINNFEEARMIGGYSEEWRDTSGNPKWSLCQAAYSHFRLFAMSPAIFYNVYDPATHKAAVSAASQTVENHLVKLPEDAIDDSSLTVTASETTLVKGTDFETYYDGENFVIELLPDSEQYGASALTVGYNKVALTAITADTISTAIEKIEECKALHGIVPDLICCPGWSQTPAVAAVMAVKAANINGLFKGKAVVDLDTSSSGADSYEDVLTYKTANGYTDDNMIVCWPLVKVGEYVFDYSVILCGHMANIDAQNDSVPYESPSNKILPITACVNKAGSEIYLSVQPADTVSYGAGVVTAINYNGWRCWGNYTGCFPADDDVAKCFICTNRMMDFICNTFVNTYWEYVDRPFTRVLVDAIVNSFNTYLDGLAHDGKIYGGEIRYVEDNNPAENILAGKFRLDTKMASPVPAQQIDMFVEYNIDLLVEALNQQ